MTKKFVCFCFTIPVLSMMLLANHAEAFDILIGSKIGYAHSETMSDWVGNNKNRFNTGIWGEIGNRRHFGLKLGAEIEIPPYYTHKIDTETTVSSSSAYGAGFMVSPFGSFGSRSFRINLGLGLLWYSFEETNDGGGNKDGKIFVIRADGLGLVPSISLEKAIHPIIAGLQLEYRILETDEIKYSRFPDQRDYTAIPHDLKFNGIILTATIKWYVFRSRRNS